MLVISLSNVVTTIETPLLASFYLIARGSWIFLRRSLLEVYKICTAYNFDIYFNMMRIFSLNPKIQDVNTGSKAVLIKHDLFFWTNGQIFLHLLAHCLSVNVVSQKKIIFRM